ncbi:MAG: hypothetical protein RJQ08_08225 [Salinisphaeraceae bacterium]
MNNTLLPCQASFAWIVQRYLDPQQLADQKLVSPVLISDRGIAITRLSGQAHISIKKRNSP